MSQKIFSQDEINVFSDSDGYIVISQNPNDGSETLESLIHKDYLVHFIRALNAESVEK